MASALQNRETRQIDLATPVPLHIVYLTAWADGTGRVQFRNDVYAMDSPLAAGKPMDSKASDRVAMAKDVAPMPACAAVPGQIDILR